MTGSRKRNNHLFLILRFPYNKQQTVCILKIHNLRKKSPPRSSNNDKLNTFHLEACIKSFEGIDGITSEKRLLKTVEGRRGKERRMAGSIKSASFQGREGGEGRGRSKKRRQRKIFSEETFHLGGTLSSFRAHLNYSQASSSFAFVSGPGSQRFLLPRSTNFLSLSKTFS